MGEKMAQDYAHRHGMEVIILRPRAFIPSWNNAVYKNFLQWADWFMKGAVHIDDFKQATLLAIDLKLPRTAPTFIIDGKYDYSLKDLTEWDKDGAGSTFKKTYPEFVALAQQHGIDTTRKPKVLTPAPTEQLPGYAPQYSMRNLLQELQDFGLAGPAAPFNAKAEGPHHARPLSP
jgi:nucleoside-diphosphate-sugar epimerase